MEYWSTSYSQWIETVVEQVRPTGEVQVACKPGYWMPTGEQSQKLREKPGLTAATADEGHDRRAEAALKLLGRAEKPSELPRAAPGGYPRRDSEGPPAAPPPAGRPAAAPAAGKGEKRDEVDAGLPPQSALDDLDRDPRETFQALRNWLKSQQREDTLVAAGRSLDSNYRRSLFAFLCAIPARKPIFQNQARELLEGLKDINEWRSDDVVSDGELQAALTPAPRKGSLGPPPAAGIGTADPPPAAGVGGAEPPDAGGADLPPPPEHFRTARANCKNPTA